MVEAEDRPPKELAEEKKNQGNQALKEGKLDDAIQLYTEAITICKTEAMLTNRAVAYI